MGRKFNNAKDPGNVASCTVVTRLHVDVVSPTSGRSSADATWRTSGTAWASGQRPRFAPSLPNRVCGTMPFIYAVCSSKTPLPSRTPIVWKKFAVHSNLYWRHSKPSSPRRKRNLLPSRHRRTFKRINDFPSGFWSRRALSSIKMVLKFQRFPEILRRKSRLFPFLPLLLVHHLLPSRLIL